MKRLLPLIYLTCVTSSITCFSQSLAEKEIRSAMTTMAQLIDDNYVFADKGKKIAAHLLQEHKKGKFDQVKNWKVFDSLTTKCLRDFSHDGHLYVKNDPLMVKELRTGHEEKLDSNKSVSSVSNLKNIENNYGFREVKIFEGNIGYVKISEININEKSLPILFASMQFVANTKALIIDLRDNGGGGSDVGAFLETLFLPRDTPLLEFRTRDGKSSIGRTLEWIPIQRYEKPLFVIVNNKTASAAEYFAYVLQVRKRATIVGQRSAGAANLNSWYVVNDQIYLSISTAAPTIPGTEESWEQKGVQPDYIVENGTEIEFIRTLTK